MLSIQHLDKRFGGVHATRDVSIDFPEGSLTAIIGPNGAGKTTFFNLISGALRPDSGKVLFEGRDIVGKSSVEVVRLGMARAFQVAAMFPTLTVRQALTAAVTSQRRQSWTWLKRFPLTGTTEAADEIIEQLGLQARAGTLSRNLSHGDQKLLDIGLALAMRPKVLLLDEPTAGMGPDERWRMIGKVQQLWQARAMTVLFIEHDMDIVFKIAQTIHVLKYGAVLAQGTPEQIRSNRDVIDAYLGSDHRLAQAAGEAG
ncbi:MAG: ABC transporter ATP-binding protein [Burkholderiaceae bacterium]